MKTALLSELLKLRIFMPLALIAVGAGPAVAVIICATLPVTQNSGLADLSAENIVSASALGLDACAVATIVLASVAVGSEFSTGQITQSLWLTPRRRTLFGAKLGSVGIISIGITIVALAGTSVVAAIALAIGGHDPFAVVAGNSIRTLFGSALRPVFYGLVAACAAMVFRSTGGAIMTALTLVLVAGITPWFGDRVAEALAPVSPSAAIHSVAGLASHVEELGALGGTVTLVCWIVAASVIAVTLFARRDGGS